MKLLIVERIQVNVMSYSVSIVSNHRGDVKTSWRYEVSWSRVVGVSEGEGVDPSHESGRSVWWSHDKAHWSKEMDENVRRVWVNGSLEQQVFVRVYVCVRQLHLFVRVCVNNTNAVAMKSSKAGVIKQFLAGTSGKHNL